MGSQNKQTPTFRVRKMPPPWLMIRGCPAVLAQKFQQLQQLQFSVASALCAKRWKEKSVPAYTSRFSNPVREVAGMKAPLPDKTDQMYDLKPHKLKVEKHGRYLWCGCGLARTAQPLCDGTCQNLNMRKLVKTGPVEYVAPETKEVWFCNCKQTNNRPFCDGSHRSEDVQNHRFDNRPQFWEPRKKSLPRRTDLIFQY